MNLKPTFHSSIACMTVGCERHIAVEVGGEDELGGHTSDVASAVVRSLALELGWTCAPWWRCAGHSPKPTGRADCGLEAAS